MIKDVSQLVIVSDFGDSYRIYRACQFVFLTIHQVKELDIFRYICFIFSKTRNTESHRLLADISIVSVVLVILGVPGKVLVIVHVEERFPSLGTLVEVGEGHCSACDPVKTALLHTSCPVVCPVLGVDHHQDVFDELVLLLVEDVSEVGALLSAAVHGGLKVEPGRGEPVAAGVVVMPTLLANLSFEVLSFIFSLAFTFASDF